jgi:hypothetical protein
MGLQVQRVGAAVSTATLWVLTCSAVKSFPLGPWQGELLYLIGQIATPVKAWPQGVAA